VLATGYAVHGFHRVDLAYGMTNITLERKIILTLGAILIIAPLTAVFGKFASCKYICWQAPFMILGTMIRDYFNFRGLRLRTDPGKCTGCKACTLKCPMNIDVMENVKNNRLKHTECILCGNCIDTCKHQAIRFTVKHGLCGLKHGLHCLPRPVGGLKQIKADYAACPDLSGD